MTIQIAICIAIFALALFMLASRIYPMGIACAITLALFIVTGCVTPAEAIALFGNKNVIVLVGMSVVGAAFLRTQFVNTCVNVLVKISGGKFQFAYIGFILVAAILVNCGIDPTVLFLMLYPLMVMLCERFSISRTKALHPWLIGYIGAMGALPLSSLVTQSAMINGYLESYGFTEIITPAILSTSRLPSMILTVLYAIFIAPKLAPALPVTEIREQGSGTKDHEKLPPFKEACGIIIFVGTIIALLLSSKLGLEPYQIALVAGILVPATRILDEKSTIQAIPVSLVFLFCGSMSIGMALRATGAGDLIGSLLANLLGGTHNSYLIGFVFWIVPFILTQFMMNQTTTQCFIPVILLTCQALGANPIGPMALMFCASCTAYMTPMASSYASACAEAGGYDLRSMFKTGLPISLVVSVVAVAWTMTIYPCF